MNKERIIRRRKRNTDEMPLNMDISRGRTFSTSIPDGVPYDNKDADMIYEELSALRPTPDEIQLPVADGLMGLVCDTFSVTYWDDPREDIDIMLDFEDAIRAGLRNRAFRDITDS